MAQVSPKDLATTTVEWKAIPADQLTPCLACCCQHQSLFLKFPDCCSSYQKGEQLCIEGEGGWGLAPFECALKGNAQQLCCVSAMALPPTDDVPFGLGMGKTPEVTYGSVKKLTDDDMKCVCHMCCNHLGIFTTAPDCLGGGQEMFQCCIKSKQACKLKTPTTCQKTKGNNMCLHQACAFPPTDDVPFAIGFCGTFLVGSAAK